MSSSSSSKIEVRFLIDREKKRVVLAEAPCDFVDVLFSFLTQPLGRIVRLLSKKSGLGPLDSLYESVERLDAKHLLNETCKDLLLNPRSAAAIQCEDLEVKGIHEPNPRRFYTCGEEYCLSKSVCYYTYASNALCIICGKLMVKNWLWPKETSDEKGVFVHDAVNLIIADDLRVIPCSSMNGFSLLKETQIEDGSILQEMTIDFGTKEVLDLLRRSLVSKTALTDVCFPDATVLDVPDYSSPIEEEIVLDNEVEKLISLELVLNKRDSNVLYAEVGKDFVNLMFSLLTFPLGSVFRILSDKPASFGCIKNLYSSVKQMSLGCFKSEACKDMLLNPKLSTFHGFKNQLLEFKEIESKMDFDTKPAPRFCYRRVKETRFIEQSPKSANGVPNQDGAFVAGSRKYMVMDTLHISPLSFISVMGNDGMNIPISDLVRKEVLLDKVKARSLLSAIMMGSKTVLTEVFFPKLNQCGRGEANTNS